MKQLSRHLEKDRSGSIKLECEEPEDMWHIYNLIFKGDLVKASTERRIRMETSTGSSASTRLRLTLCIQVTEVVFDPSTCQLRINGRNQTENQHVKLGAFHTIDLELNQAFTIIKEEWDRIDLDRISDACDITKNAEVAAIVLQEGLANVCLVTNHMTIVRQRVEVPIPRKRRGSVTNHEKGMIRFYEQIYQAMLHHFNWEVLKVVIIAGPGFIKDQFYQYIFDQATKSDLKPLLQSRYKFVVVSASSGHKHALQEILTHPTIKNQLADTQFTLEVNALQNFYTMLDKDSDRVFYGSEHVRKANQLGAIDTLLISDTLFRSSDIPMRKLYSRMVEAIRNSGGQVRFFSSMHPSGEQLNQLSGIAAILKFPLPDIDDMILEDN